MTLNAEQQREVEILTRLEAGVRDAETAGELLGVSARQVRRLRVGSLTPGLLLRTRETVPIDTSANSATLRVLLIERQHPCAASNQWVGWACAGRRLLNKLRKQYTTYIPELWALVKIEFVVITHKSFES